MVFKLKTIPRKPILKCDLEERWTQRLDSFIFPQQNKTF